MARYDDDDDRGGPYGGTYADRAQSSDLRSYGWRDRNWDDEDDSYRRPGGRSLRGQGFAEYDEELGGARRGFSSLDSDDEGQGWRGNGPGYQESHGRDWGRDDDRERSHSSSGYRFGARYDDEDNRGRDRYWPSERGSRGEWSSQRSRYDDDDVERAGYGRGWSSDSERTGERWGSYGRRRDWDDDDDDRRGWISGRSSWRREDDGDGRREESRGFAGMDPERRRELASRGGRASARSRRDDDRGGRRSEVSRYDDDRRGGSRRGFAAMDPRRHRQISRMGGRASHRDR
jgi:hypothetical protein